MRSGVMIDAILLHPEVCWPIPEGMKDREKLREEIRSLCPQDRLDIMRKVESLQN